MVCVKATVCGDQFVQSMRKRSEKTALRAVLFDWDGTLLNSYQADSRAYLAMFHAMGINWGMEELAQHYSPDWYRVYRAARLPRVHWDEADRLWGRFYNKQKPLLLPGVRRVLRQLGHRFILGLVTSGGRARVCRQLHHFGLFDLFAARICCEDASRRKPHRAPLVAALRQLRLKPRECVYVGDSPDDIEMARAAGMRAVAVLGPFPTHDRVRAARPDALLTSIAELPALLKNY